MVRQFVSPPPLPSISISTEFLERGFLSEKTWETHGELMIGGVDDGDGGVDNNDDIDDDTHDGDKLRCPTSLTSLSSSSS